MSAPSITPDELQVMAKSGRPIELIDVRTPAEYRECHAVGARLVPLDRLDPAAVMTGRTAAANEPLYVICRSGGRAKQACDRFVAAGYSNVVCVEGGTLAWEQAGCEVVRGKKAISLERQVRIAAGSLVLVGAILALTVHTWFVGLSAFVGAGLVFAGITDTCGMGMLLAKMPWNQVNDRVSACAVK
jgi:rhodanese-related sulfurtransferase